MEDAVPYEIKRSEELGRYLVAMRDIDVREIIIREEPLISGPSDRGPKNVPVCLGCSCVMYEGSMMNRCTTCHWPVCNEDCEKLASHSQNECKIFQTNHVSYPPPNGWPHIGRSIFILRCLLLKNSNPKQWEQLMNMLDNGEIRKCRPNCINTDKRILENFTKFFPTTTATAVIAATTKEKIAEDEELLQKEVIRISGIIDTNAHAFPLKVNERTTTVCNLYSRTSLMAHSCSPNASWSPDKSYSSLTLTIRANVPILKGSLISVAYDEGQLLLSTLRRLIPNEINGMFICKCERCLDPTEFGTFIGAIKCPQCEQGYLLPIDPVDSFSSWKCDNVAVAGGRSKGIENSNISSTETEEEEKEEKNKEEEPECFVGCNLVLDDETVMEIIEDAESMCGYTKINLASLPSRLNQRTEIGNPEEEEENDDDETLELLKEFVREYSGNILHPNHYILQEVNVRIVKREYGTGLSQLSLTDLICFLERSKKLLEVADVLTPGFCEFQAFLQFYFCQGLLNLERRKEEATKMGLPLEMWKSDSYNNAIHTDTDETNDDVTNNSTECHDRDCKRDHNSDLHGNEDANNIDDDDSSNKNKSKETTEVDTHNLNNQLQERVSSHDDDKDIENNKINEGQVQVTSSSSSNTGVDIMTSSESELALIVRSNYYSTQKNLRRIKKMLTFLLSFFLEINPSHKLLEPISDTLEDTEMRLSEMEE